MALSEKERERIVEEENLRHETRAKLQAAGGCGHGGNCRHCRSRRIAFWIILALIVLGVFNGMHRRSYCPFDVGYGRYGRMMEGWQPYDAREPEQAPAKK